jgi:hypothetical protein
MRGNDGVAPSAEVRTRTILRAGKTFRTEAQPPMGLPSKKAGGAVFSVGSITFCGSLSHNNYQNNVSRMLENVLRRFLTK